MRRDESGGESPARGVLELVYKRLEQQDHDHIQWKLFS
jgi:hypothetical protein